MEHMGVYNHAPVLMVVYHYPWEIFVVSIINKRP